MHIHLAALWFVVDRNDVTSLPDDAYTTQGEAERAAERLTKSRARIMPDALPPSARRFEDVWSLIRDNVRNEAAIEEARAQDFARDR